MINTEVQINLSSQVATPIIQAVQGDTGRSVTFVLSDLVIPSGAEATYYVAKPSGECVYNVATISGNNIICDLTAQSLAEVGENNMQIRVLADGKVVTSFEALLMVRAFIGDSSVESSTESTVFDQYFENAKEEFHEAAQEVADEVIQTIPADYTALSNQVGQLNERLEYENVAIENLFNGSMYFPDLSIGSTNAQNGEYQPTYTHHITTPNWFIPKYPFKVKLENNEYSCRLIYNDNGTISYENLTDENLLYPNLPTKIDIWKTNAYDALNLKEVRNVVSLQTTDDYLAKILKMNDEKNRNAYELFNGFVRRGALSANGAYLNYVNYRCATPYIINETKDIRVLAASGFRFAVRTFNSEGEQIGDLGWKTDYTIEANQGFKLIIARTTDDQTEIADPYTFLMALNVESVYATKEEITDIQLPMLERGYLQNGNKPHLAVHTGYHNNFPGNSIPAFEAGGKLGYWGIESDVNETSDGYLVMIHDTTLDATTTGTGAVNEKTLDEILQLRLTGTDLKVPTLEEFLGVCKRYSCVPVIEIKGTVTNNGIIKIVNTLKKFGLDKTSILIGSKWSLPYVRGASEYIPYLSIYQYAVGADFDSELTYNKGFKYAGMCWEYSYGINIAKSEAVHDNDMLLATFTVDNEEGVMSAFQAGVDFVTTNNVLPN